MTNEIGFSGSVSSRSKSTLAWSRVGDGLSGPEQAPINSTAAASIAVDKAFESVAGGLVVISTLGMGSVHCTGRVWTGWSSLAV